jgi:hypothetical protein
MHAIALRNPLPDGRGSVAALNPQSADRRKRLSHLVLLWWGRRFRLPFGLGTPPVYNWAILRCTSRKYKPSSTVSPPTTEMVTGAV